MKDLHTFSTLQLNWNRPPKPLTALPSIPPKIHLNSLKKSIIPTPEQYSSYSATKLLLCLFLSIACNPHSYNGYFYKNNVQAIRLKLTLRYISDRSSIFHFPNFFKVIYSIGVIVLRCRLQVLSHPQKTKTNYYLL